MLMLYDTHLHLRCIRRMAWYFSMINENYQILHSKPKRVIFEPQKKEEPAPARARPTPVLVPRTVPVARIALRNMRRYTSSPASTKRQLHACRHCGKVYAVARSLWRHEKFECVNALPKLHCDLCDYTSPHRWCLDTHRLKRHGASALKKVPVRNRRQNVDQCLAVRARARSRGDSRSTLRCILNRRVGLSELRQRSPVLANVGRATGHLFGGGYRRCDRQQYQWQGQAEKAPRQDVGPAEKAKGAKAAQHRQELLLRALLQALLEARQSAPARAQILQVRDNAEEEGDRRQRWHECEGGLKLDILQLYVSAASGQNRTHSHAGLAAIAGTSSSSSSSTQPIHIEHHHETTRRRDEAREPLREGTSRQAAVRLLASRRGQHRQQQLRQVPLPQLPQSLQLPAGPAAARQVRLPQEAPLPVPLLSASLQVSLRRLQSRAPDAQGRERLLRRHQRGRGRIMKYKLARKDDTN
ncbi:unnamed protein product [Trichogramma brassicae]|uniref:Uncharacterized protein n=1 Tax=Trichogramma brassicae TaxID=86971 RepID=A0A6H5HSE0_9HYME|nr:unnamed protein product [Trichogramma brassicae]